MTKRLGFRDHLDESLKSRYHRWRAISHENRAQDLRKPGVRLAYHTLKAKEHNARAMMDEARARSRGMNKGRPHQPAFLSGDNLVGRVLDADERARVARKTSRDSSPRRKPTMPRFSFSGKPIPEERVDELYGKGRFGEIRRHAQYTRDKPTADRADAIVDDAGRERRAELRAKSRAGRRKNEDVLDEGTESYHLRLAGHHEDQASEHDKGSAKYQRHVDAANRHYEKAHQAAERKRPAKSPERRKK